MAARRRQPQMTATRCSRTSEQGYGAMHTNRVTTGMSGLFAVTTVLLLTQLITGTVAFPL